MIRLEIPLEPVPWAAHRGYGKRSFNPRFKEREAYQWYIKERFSSHHEAAASEKGIVCHYLFCLPIPKSWSKKKKEKALNGEISHTKKPDLDNLNKFLGDCLKGIVFVDDSQIVTISSFKSYSDKPRVVIEISEAS